MTAPLVIGLAGPDGAGKSSLARRLQMSLPGTRVVHLYGCIACRRLPGPARAGLGSRRTGLAHSGLEAMEHRLRLALATWTSRRSDGGRRIVVADRTPLDTLVKLDPPPGSFRQRLLARPLRRFDTVFWLDAPVAVLAGRDCEHSPDELAGMSERFREWSGRFPGVVRLDARRPLAELEAELRRRMETETGPARGFAVALVGPDGAGKSSLARAVQAELGLPVRVVYMGIWRPGFLRHLGAAASLVQLAYRPFKLWAYYLLALRHMRRGRVVVFERYTYDAVVPPRPPLRGLKSVYLAGIARLLPAPDLVLLLDARGGDLFGRKGQHSPERLQEAADALRSGLRSVPQARVVDAGRPFAEVKAEVLAAIRECAEARGIDPVASPPSPPARPLPDPSRAQPAP